MSPALIILFALAATPSGETHVEITRKAVRDYRAVDEALGVAIGAYRQRLEEIQRRKFDAAQEAWTQFRDRWCEFLASGVEGGSAHILAASKCMKQFTERRLAEIKKVAACREGDLACPAWRR